MSRKSSGIRLALRRRCYPPDPTKLRLEIEWRVYLMGHQRPTSTSQSLTRGVKGGTKIRESTERVSGGRGVRRKGCQGGEPERRPLTHRVLCSGVKTKVACPVTGTGLIKQAVVVRRPWQPPEIRRPPASGSLQAANLSSFLSALFETASNK